MQRYFSSQPKNSYHESNSINQVVLPTSENQALSSSSQPQESRFTDEGKVDLETLEADPGLRKKISDFHPNIQDEVRITYLLKGPYQPRIHSFPTKVIGGKNRRFVSYWFDEYDWLEYSIVKDAAFCLPCYLFKSESEAGGDHFVGKGFIHWNKKQRFEVHVGSYNSPHFKATKKCEDLIKQKQNIEASFIKQSKQVKSDYLICLDASIQAVRFLLEGGMALIGHDESEDSLNRGNFLRFLEALRHNNEAIARVVLGNAPKNNQMTSSEIQKDISYAFAYEIINEIVNEIGDDFFGILVDEAGDIAKKEQMSVVLRYVDDRGFVMERFVGIVYVKDTTTLSFKAALESMLSQYGLCLSKVRGQGYDGASNMRGEFGGLKTLIQYENPCAYYVHCFAHQLQLALIAVVKCHNEVSCFLSNVTRVVNVIGSSNKRQDSLRDKQVTDIANALDEGLIESGRGLNQESVLVRADDTHWGSHLMTFLSLKNLFSPVIKVLEDLEADRTFDKNGDATFLLYGLQTFDFIFMLHLMINIMGVTCDLSQALQKNDQDILNALALVEIAKERLQEMRDDGWEGILNEVILFCNKRDIDLPNMNEQYVKGKRSTRQAPIVTNLHHYKYDCLYSVIDSQLKELNCRFDVVSTELLSCVACLHPSSSFEAFNKQSLIRLTAFYPDDFSNVDVVVLDNQLENYIRNVRSDNRFHGLKGLVDLSRKLVQTKMHKTYPFVYRLVKLALILPVATASVERVFSAMNFIKTASRNKMCDQWLQDCLVTFIERDVFNSISNDVIVNRFQSMKTRRIQL